MVLTFLGCSKCTAFFIGDDTSLPRVINRGLEAVNYLLLVGATILAAYSFILLHQIFHDFTITIAMIMAFIVMFVIAVHSMFLEWWNTTKKSFHHLTKFFMSTWWGYCKNMYARNEIWWWPFWATCKIEQPIQPIWQQFLPCLGLLSKSHRVRFIVYFCSTLVK